MRGRGPRRASAAPAPAPAGTPDDPIEPSRTPPDPQSDPLPSPRPPRMIWPELPRTDDTIPRIENRQGHETDHIQGAWGRSEGALRHQDESGEPAHSETGGIPDRH